MPLRLHTITRFPQTSPCAGGIDRTATAERLCLELDAASWNVDIEMAHDVDEAQYEWIFHYMIAVARRFPMYGKARFPLK